MNIAMAVLFYSTFDEFSRTDNWTISFLHYFCLYGSLVCLAIFVPSFIFSATLDPGYLTKQYDFISLVTDFIKEE